MSEALLQEVYKTGLKQVPNLKPGCTVKIYQKIKEGEKERTQVFEGLVIKISSGRGLDKTFTVRRIASGVGVEKVFPVYSKNIAKIEIVRQSDVRRAKLYYMRGRSGKSARLKEGAMEEATVSEPVAKKEVAEMENKVA